MSDPSRTPTMTIASGIARERQPRYPPVPAVKPVKYGNDQLRALFGPDGARTDFALAPTVFLNADWCADQDVKRRIQEAERKAAAEGKIGGLLATNDGSSCLPGRPRGAFVVAAQDMFDAFSPDERIPLQAYTIADRCSRSVAYTGGTWLAMKRLAKYLPSTGTNVRALSPPSLEEARQAVVASGYGNSRGDLLPIMDDLDEPAVAVSWDSSNGFPVGLTMADPEARKLCRELAEQLRAGIDRAANKTTYIQHLRGGDPRVAKPLLFLFTGKVKYDVYPVEKLEQQELRFYNVVPRPTSMVMQQATQVVGACHQPVPLSNSAQGLALTGGGAATLIKYLDPDLASGVITECVKYVHCGDDSFICAADASRNAVYLLSADCSSFDLTQHRRVTTPVHDALRDEIAKVDEGSAALWHSCMQRRDVVLTGSKVVTMTHGGPSGMPLQSAVNDVLMEVLLNRAKKEMEEVLATTEGDLNAERAGDRLKRILEETGRSMGFVTRVDDLTIVEGTTSLPQALSQKAFKFIGYWFYSEGPSADDIRVVCDLERNLAGLPYPNSLAQYSSEVRAVQDALKFVGVSISMGVPPTAWVPMWDAYTKCARASVKAAEAAIGKLLDEGREEELWNLVGRQLNVFTGLRVESLRQKVGRGGLLEGLEKCLSEDFRYELWSGTKLPELGGESWADQVDAENQEYDEALRAWAAEKARILEALRNAGLPTDSVVIRPPPMKPIKLGTTVGISWGNWGQFPTLQQSESTAAKEKSTGWGETLKRAARHRRPQRGAKRSGVVLPEDEVTSEELDEDWTMGDRYDDMADEFERELDLYALD